MPTIRLQDGDFGADTDVTVGLSSIYLPDPARPGVMFTLSFDEITAIDSVTGDRADELEADRDVSVGGLMRAGPLGLLNGVRSVGRGKDVVFKVRLRDGRAFVAVAGARIYADLRSEWVSARGVLQMEDDAGKMSGADAIIAKYLRARASSTAPADDAPELPLQSSRQSGPDTVDAAPEPQPAESFAERRVIRDRRAQPEFGRRRPQDD